MTAVEFSSTEEALHALADRILLMVPERRQAFVDQIPDPEHRAVVVELVERAMAEKIGVGVRSDPATLAHHLDPTYRTPKYVRFLSKKFKDGIEGRSPRQIWNLPGRYGKSLLACWGVVWALDRRPSARFIITAYGDTLADEDSDLIRERLRLYAGFLRVTLRRDRQRLDRFVTDEGGGLISAGIDATITGFGVNKGGALVVDDPFKNWQQAHSETRRDHVHNQFRGTLRNRLDDEDAFILVIHHRLHEDDLTARLTTSSAEEDEYGDVWDVTSLPSLAGEHDILERAPGEPLDPDRFTERQVRNRIASLGSYLASALELQNPTPEEGNDVKRAWFRIEDRRPDRADEWLSSWDTKMKDKEGGDYVVGQMWARTGKDFWLMDQLRGQWDRPTTVAAVCLLAVRWPQCAKHAIEAAALGPEVRADLQRSIPTFVLSDEIASQLGMTDDEREAVQELRRRGMSGVVMNPVQGDKRARMRFVTPVIEAGDVHLWENSDFLESYLDEIAAFPNGTHDDQCDTTSQALTLLSKRVGRRRKLSGQAQRETAATSV